METLTYQQWLNQFKRQWEPGQHVLIVGPTGSGKTVAAQDMLLLKKYVVAIATKSKDKSLDGYKGFTKRSNWPPDFHERKILYWKKPKALGDFTEQQIGIYQVLADVYKRGGWTVYFDDLIYVTNTLHLKEPIKMFYTQVRSQGVSIVSSLQRPFWAPLEAVSQSTYALVFAAHDRHDVRRLAEGLSIDYQELLTAIRDLQPYEFIFLRTGKQPIKIGKKGNI